MGVLKPNKYTNIDLSVLGIGTELLQQLAINPYQKYSQLYEKVIKRKGESAKENFLLSLNFLYSLGKIEYHPHQDIIELTVRNLR